MLYRLKCGASTTEIGVAEARSGGTAQIGGMLEPNEWSAGHLTGAVHISCRQLAARQQELDRTQLVLAVDRGGSQAAVAADQLVAAGFRDAQSLAGWVKGSAAAGQPVER